MQQRQQNAQHDIPNQQHCRMTLIMHAFGILYHLLISTTTVNLCSVYQIKNAFIHPFQKIERISETRSIWGQISAVGVIKH